MVTEWSPLAGSNMRNHSNTGTARIVGLDAVSEAVVHPHVFANTEREVGGVLVGSTDATNQLPTVSGAIPAVGATERRASLTFTQEAWEHIHSTLARDFADETQIVGWYHSHPGIGIYLSDQDLFIHKNFFALPSQIALVVDPLAGTEGVFVWDEGRVVKRYEQPVPERWVEDR